MVVIALMMREAKSADQNPVTSNLSLHRAVRASIAALITKTNKPKVTMETGKVSTLIMDPKIELMSPNKSATHKYVVTPPLTVMPGTTRVATHIERASIAQRNSNFISRAFLVSIDLQTCVMDRT